MADCIFCRIVRKEIPCHELLRTETVLAFLDRNPLSKGHALLVPTAHARLLQELPEEVAADLGRALHRLVPAIGKAVGAPAALVAIHNGPEAGQEVAHAHWHLVPRSGKDEAGPIHALFRRPPQVPDTEQAQLVTAIRGALG